VFFDTNKLPPSKLQELIGLNDKSGRYFELMVGLFYIKKDKNYSKVKMKIISFIKKILNNKNSFSDSELTHLFFDTIACPYISKKHKIEIIIVMLKSNNQSIDNVDYIFYLLSKRTWFIEWKNEEAIIEKLLLKKELRTPYGS
ncbi:hypothetical protein I5434_22035, partial [Citrobacter freundii]|nr:hypothetical protein [Citrobacter freundii]